MGFRDDADAARARAEALERENRELQEKIAELEGTKTTTARESDGSGPSSNLLIGGGIAAIVIGGVVVGLRAPMLLPFVAVAAMLMIGAGILKRLIEVVGPNEVLVISGRPRRVGDKIVGYRVVRGGRVVRLPFLERADRMSLETILLELELKEALAKGGARVDLRATSAVKIASHEPALHNAVERFLCRDREEVKSVALETVMGGLRGVVAALTLEQLREDRLSVEQHVVAELEHDLQKLGLELDTFTIQQVREKTS